MQNSLGHLLKIRFAFTQIRIFHFVELATNHFHLTADGPFGVVEPVFNPVLDAQGQAFILKQHQVHIEQCAQLWWGVVG